MIDALLVVPSLISASKSASPGHPNPPPLCVPVSGPGTSFTFPVVKTIPLWNGNEEPFPSKYPIPLSVPKSAPDDQVTLFTIAQYYQRESL